VAKDLDTGKIADVYRCLSIVLMVYIDAQSVAPKSAVGKISYIQLKTDSLNDSSSNLLALFSNMPKYFNIAGAHVSARSTMGVISPQRKPRNANLVFG